MLGEKSAVTEHNSSFDDDGVGDAVSNNDCICMTSLQYYFWLCRCFCLSHTYAKWVNAYLDLLPGLCGHLQTVLD